MIARIKNLQGLAVSDIVKEYMITSSKPTNSVNHSLFLLMVIILKWLRLSTSSPRSSLDGFQLKKYIHQSCSIFLQAWHKKITNLYYLGFVKLGFANLTCAWQVRAHIWIFYSMFVFVWFKTTHFCLLMMMMMLMMMTQLYSSTIICCPSPSHQLCWAGCSPLPPAQTCHRPSWLQQRSALQCIARQLL